MKIQEQIKKYITSQPEPKRSELEALHRIILQAIPKCKLWFLDGKDDKGKVVSNPNAGYGSYTIKYADGTTREFYQIGLSANTTGISIYIMGIKDKKYLAQMFVFAETPFNVGDSNIAKIAAPVLIISGDNDGTDKIVLIKTYQLLGGGVTADMQPMPKSQLAIVPSQGHVSLMMQTTTILNYLNSFLK